MKFMYLRSNLKSIGFALLLFQQAVYSMPIPSSQTPAVKAAPSFYKRSLPYETCVDFSSRRGKHIFASAMANGGLKSFFGLIQQFHTQSEPAFCGLATLVLVLNAFAVDPEVNWKGPWRWYEETMLNCCLDLEDVKKTGITMKDFRCLAHCQGLSVDLYHCDDSTLEDFRSVLEIACVSQDESEGNDQDFSNGMDSFSLADPLENVLVVSYSRKVVKQTGSGHFAALAAYDKESDSVLILDTARFKYGAHWVTVPLLYDAMNTLDPNTGKSRGFVLLRKPTHHQNIVDSVTSTKSLQPISFLFRSKLTQNPTRREFKSFLEGLEREVTWEEIIAFWEKKKENVWSIIEPLRLPKEEEYQTFVTDLRELLANLLSAINCATESCCHRGVKGNCLSEKEALYIVYLASVSEARRREIISTQSPDTSIVAQERLLDEARSIANAIFHSYESTF